MLSLFWLKMMQSHRSGGAAEQRDNRITHHRGHIFRRGVDEVLLFFTPSWPPSLRLLGAC